MARQQDYNTWGSANVDGGCEISNIVPQAAAVNNGPCGQIDDAHRSAVAILASGIKALWVVSGQVFDTDSPRTVGRGIAAPDACSKVVG